METAWLIEGPGPNYLGIWEYNRTFIWTLDHNRAMRFSRQIDAGSAMMIAQSYQPELFVAGVWERTAAVEHAWVDPKADVPVQGTTLQALQAISAARSQRWHADGEPWLVVDWTNAIAGEVGECCNAAKKLRRIDTNAQHKGLNRDEVVEQILVEATDALLYIPLLFTFFKADMAQYVTKVFNAKSIEYGFPERLPES